MADQHEFLAGSTFSWPQSCCCVKQGELRLVAEHYHKDGSLIARYGLCSLRDEHLIPSGNGAVEFSDDTNLILIFHVITSSILYEQSDEPQTVDWSDLIEQLK